jgi:hypothetical protein
MVGSWRTITPTSIFRRCAASVKFADVIIAALQSTMTHFACRLARSLGDSASARGSYQSSGRFGHGQCLVLNSWRNRARTNTGNSSADSAFGFWRRCRQRARAPVVRVAGLASDRGCRCERVLNEPDEWTAAIARPSSSRCTCACVKRLWM